MPPTSTTPPPPALRRWSVTLIAGVLLSTMTASGFAWADLTAPTAPVAPTAPTASAASPAVVPQAAAAPVSVPAPTTVADAVQSPVPAAAAPVAAVSAQVQELLDSATAAGLACSLVEALPLCTHGDEAHTAESSGSTVTAPEVPVGCAGDGRSGNRVQVVYVRQSDKPDRFGSVAATLRKQVNIANGVFHRSSGGKRQLRVVTDAKCSLAIERVTLTPSQAGSITATFKALRAGGRNRVDRKYLVFVDNGLACGVAEYYLDDRAGPINRNNDGNMLGAVYNRCWNGVVVAHELTHMLGGVQPSAPRSTGKYAHCTDQHDVMCYRDGSGKTMTTRCASSHRTLLDCGKDDYFNVAPRAGSYLSKYWNTARSSFLVGGGAPKPTPPSAPVSVTSARTGDNVRIAWGTPLQHRSGIAAFDVVDLAASGKVVATVGGTSRAATVTLTPWRTYRLAVVARNGAGTSAPAGGHQHMVGRPPAAPATPRVSYTVAGLGVDVRLSWTAPQHAESYVVFRDGKQVGVSTSTSWTDSAAVLAQKHSYTVVARNVWGGSPQSRAASSLGL